MGRVFFVLVVSACGASYVESRLGDPRPAKTESCQIEWLSIDASPANGHDEIAMLSNMSVGSNPASAEAREQVRQRACALGGDAATLVASANDAATYIVWANKPCPPGSCGSTPDSDLTSGCVTTNPLIKCAPNASGVCAWTSMCR